MIIKAEKVYKLLETNIHWQQIYRNLLERVYIIKEKREADFLLLNATDRYMNFIKEYPHINKMIRQHHIASYLGITPESLSRIRAQLGIS